MNTNLHESESVVGRGSRSVPLGPYSCSFVSIRGYFSGFSQFCFVVVLAFVLAACGSKLTNENLTQVKHGMSEEEVVAILGKPKRVETGEILGLRGTTYYYEHGETEVVVNFINNQVSAKSGKFGK